MHGEFAIDLFFDMPVVDISEDLGCRAELIAWYSGGHGDLDVNLSASIIYAGKATLVCDAGMEVTWQHQWRKLNIQHSCSMMQLPIPQFSLLCESNERAVERLIRDVV